MTDRKRTLQAVAFEETFYKSSNGGVAIEICKRLTLEDTDGALIDVTGIDDRAVLEELRCLEITPSTLMAFSLFPSIHVAWADGMLEPSEKAAILNSAEHLGIAPESTAFKLLDSWLTREPHDELLLAWRNFIHSVSPKLSTTAFEKLRYAAMKRAQVVAQAAGGFLGFHATSESEKAAIAELESVFADALLRPSHVDES